MTKACEYAGAVLSQVLNKSPSKRTHIFRVIGQFMAKSMLDSRIIDLSFNKIFLKLVLGEQISLTLDNLKVLSNIRGYVMLLTSLIAR